jgi:hypothetical protein
MKRTTMMCTAVVVMLAAGSTLAAEVIDLDQADTLAALRRDDPQRYVTIVRLLDDASRIAPSDARGLLHVRYDAEDVNFSQILLTSDPPQRRLSFRLVDASYRATVRIKEPVARALPAR